MGERRPDDDRWREMLADDHAERRRELLADVMERLVLETTTGGRGGAMREAVVLHGPHRSRWPNELEVRGAVVMTISDDELAALEATYWLASRRRATARARARAEGTA